MWNLTEVNFIELYVEMTTSWELFVNNWQTFSYSWMEEIENEICNQIHDEVLLSLEYICLGMHIVRIVWWKRHSPDSLISSEWLCVAICWCHLQTNLHKFKITARVLLLLLSDHTTHIPVITSSQWIQPHYI